MIAIARLTFARYHFWPMAIALLWIALSLPCYLVSGQELQEAECIKPGAPFAGSMVLCSPDLALQSVRLALDKHRAEGGDILSSVQAGWTFTLYPYERIPGLLCLTATGDAETAIYEIRYLLEHAQAADSASDMAVPILATERVTPKINGAQSAVRQSIQVSVQYSNVHTVKVDLSKTTLWALKHPQELLDTGLISQLSEYLWHHQDLDSPPGSFNGIVALAYRHLELDPHSVDTYTTAAWLLWSRWVSWKGNPERMPDSEHKASEAVALLARGQGANPSSARYHYEAAITLMPLARHHLPDLHSVVQGYLEQADRMEANQDLRIRIRKSLGHHHRQLGNMAEAMAWYRKVLELDPGNEVANRYLKRLNDAQKTSTGP